MDDLGGHACSDLVDRLGLQLEPADPVFASVGHDLQPAACRPLHQMTAVLAQDDEFSAVILLADAELGHEIDDLVLVGCGICLLAEDAIHLRVHFEDVAAFGPGFSVHCTDAQKKILDIVGCELHGGLPLAVTSANYSISCVRVCYNFVTERDPTRNGSILMSLCSAVAAPPLTAGPIVKKIFIDARAKATRSSRTRNG